MSGLHAAPDAQYTHRLSVRGITRFPKKVLAYIYQISFGLITSIAFAFVVPTIVDVIIQGTEKQMVAIKAFIVLGASALFILLGLIIYVARVISYNKRMNENPTRVVYVPAEHDLPRPVYAHVEKNLARCWGSVRQQALPLLNRHACINYAGRAPSAVVQHHNLQVGLDGTLFPPNLYYEDIILSVGDRLLLQRLDDIEWGRPSPVYTFRQFLRHLHHMQSGTPDYDHLADLYDEMRYSGQLIKESTLLEFMVEFDAVARHSHQWLDWADTSLVASTGSARALPPRISIDLDSSLQCTTLLARMNDAGWYNRAGVRAASAAQTLAVPPAEKTVSSPSTMALARPRCVSRATYKSTRSGRSSVRTRLAISPSPPTARNLFRWDRHPSCDSSGSDGQDSMESVRRYQ